MSYDLVVDNLYFDYGKYNANNLKSVMDDDYGGWNAGTSNNAGQNRAMALQDKKVNFAAGDELEGVTLKALFDTDQDLTEIQRYNQGGKRGGVTQVTQGVQYTSYSNVPAAPSGNSGNYSYYQDNGSSSVDDVFFESTRKQK